MPVRYQAQSTQALQPVELATPVASAKQLNPDTFIALAKLRKWAEERGFAGYEPYDLLNSRVLPGWVAEVFPLNWLLIQAGMHLPGHALRQLLRVPRSRNPKALGLFLAGYCDLARCGEETLSRAEHLKKELIRLRSPDEPYCCWGYDWDYVSLRGSSMRAFRPNAIASVFCGQALLDMAEVFNDGEAAGMARSVGEFFVNRLNRPVDTASHLCFSYTPDNQTRILNVTALVAAFMTRLARMTENQELSGLARRSLQYLVDQQQPDGSWPYGAGPSQTWVDGFHTGYNLCALLDYAEFSGDESFADSLRRGYEFYTSIMIAPGGMPKYFKNSLYPLDIHSCSQAILVLSRLSSLWPGAGAQALAVLKWTLENMQSPDGSFYYQRHRGWVNRTPYMRWGQAWMFHSLCRFQANQLQRQADPKRVTLRQVSGTVPS